MIHGRMVTIKRRNSIFFNSLITPDINEAEVLILSVNYISLSPKSACVIGSTMSEVTPNSGCSISFTRFIKDRPDSASHYLTPTTVDPLREFRKATREKIESLMFCSKFT